VVDLKYFQNYHLSASHKMTEEDPLAGKDLLEDSPEEEDSPEVEDSPEEADTPAEVEYHPEDHLEEDGDHHQLLCPRPTKESW